MSPTPTQIDPMAPAVGSNRARWWQSRYGLATFWFGSLLISWTLLRVVLLIAFGHDSFPAGELARIFGVGFYRDILAALTFTIPMLLWFVLVPNIAFSKRWHRVLFSISVFISCFAQLFLLFVEFFFFEEFKSRYNTVAVDYLLFPQEVFVNIWQSYHVGVVVLVSLLLTVGWLFTASRMFTGLWDQPFELRSRLICVAAVLALIGILSTTIRFSAPTISADRASNQLANNGALSFLAAARTRNLEYAAFYRTLPPDEAWTRTRKLLTETNSTFLETAHSIRRQIPGETGRPRLNLVIFLEESLGSEFWGCLGASPSWTPEMDRLATQEGMLFTNLYANGNRTVRGMEGVLASFPSLPGDSIVRRHLSDNVETVARILKRDGYSTIFLYGGRGVFDGMRSFTVRNGYDRFIEQKDFMRPTFTTAWGVCDEDIFQRGIEELRALNDSGKPFLATLLSVSNHRPYTYPKGRIPEDPEQQQRAYAVKYSDYALGRFFEAAKKERFWTNTIFAVIADHGARVYGSQSIPIHSYEIPLVVLGPAAVEKPVRIGQLGCSLDVCPTLLGLIGRPYQSLLFGRDLLKMNPESGRVFLNHNRDIGMLERDRMVVFGLMQTVEFYEGDPKRVNMTPLRQPTDADRELEKDAAAIYQVADFLYTHQAYRLDPRPNRAN
jgi:phosphoglycerol transferase MdoB-like AlkP superfamily enzyme